MLPPYLKAMKASLNAKGIARRTPYENELLNELNETDQAIDDASNNTHQFSQATHKWATARSTPISGTCPQCGR